MRKNISSQLSESQNELQNQLRFLRRLIREVGGNYLAGLQAEVSRVAGTIETEQASQAPGSKRLEEIQLMTQWIKELDLVPRKGRKRDLKHIAKVISKLGDTVDSW